MILVETIYINRQPVGVVRQDTNRKQIAFSPISGKSLLPVTEWASVDELKAAWMLRATRPLIKRTTGKTMEQSYPTPKHNYRFPPLHGNYYVWLFSVKTQKPTQARRVL
jgi:hypothetical protein